ncbi:hypothetical protein GIB67_036858 [Kingdonia uniflora]|uniref:30S ribosomal protein 3, chloroplastic n=1 Tax=Kingdonia uniflora TaxID=39325 RepID=A0A7J7LX14_9MAGN|nr:hypothetical protein GIB67_036858 [Kingdonia uniflora]
MLSMATTQPHIHGAFSHITFSSTKQTFKPSLSNVSIKSNMSSLHVLSLVDSKQRLNRRQRVAATEAVVEDEVSVEESEPFEEKEGLKLFQLEAWSGCEPIEKPRLVLKFVWLEKNIGLALDQVIPGHGTIPLSPYYFWPRKDAWEELKIKLESKPWISQKRMIILLNQATDIINLWQQSGGNLT